MNHDVLLLATFLGGTVFFAWRQIVDLVPLPC